MNKKELKKLAIAKLNTKKVQNIRKQVCQYFSGEEQKKCIHSFNQSFIESFIQSAQHQL